MRAGLVLAIVAVGLVASLISSYAGLLLYSWFAFFRPQEWAWGAVSSLRLSLVIGVTFLVSALVRGQLPTLRHPLAVGMVLFLVAALVSQIGAVQPSASWDGIDMVLRMIVVSLLAITIANTPKRFAVLVAVVAGSIAFHGSKFGVGYLIRGGARFDAGMGGLFSDNNDFALAIARSIFLLVPVAQTASARWLKGGIVVALPLCVIAIISTFSRGGILATAAAAAVFLALQRRRTVAVLALAGVVAVGAALVPVSDRYVSRVATIDSARQEGDTSVLGRLHFWNVALAMVRDRPLGVGLRGYPYAYDRYDTTGGAFGTQRAVHSSHFQVLAELGYPGAGVWVYLYACAIWLLLRIRRRARQPAVDERTARFYLTFANGLAASIVAFLVGGAFLAQALNDLNWMTFALVAILDRLSASELGTEQADRASGTPELVAGIG